MLSPHRSSEAQSLLAGEYAVDPALLIGPGGVECRQRLCEFPKRGLFSNALLDKKSLQCFASPSREEQHRLVDAIEGSRASGWCSDLSPPAALCRFFNLGK